MVGMGGSGCIEGNKRKKEREREGMEREQQ